MHLHLCLVPREPLRNLTAAIAAAHVMFEGQFSNAEIDAGVRAVRAAYPINSWTILLHRDQLPSFWFAAIERAILRAALDAARAKIAALEGGRARKKR